MKRTRKEFVVTITKISLALVSVGALLACWFFFGDSPVLVVSGCSVFVATLVSVLRREISRRQVALMFFGGSLAILGAVVAAKNPSHKISPIWLIVVSVVLFSSISTAAERAARSSEFRP